MGAARFRRLYTILCVSFEGIPCCIRMALRIKPVLLIREGQSGFINDGNIRQRGHWFLNFQAETMSEVGIQCTHGRS